MPLYEFTCKECGATFEELVAASLDALAMTCPECESTGVEKLVSRFASTGSAGSDRSGGASCGPGSGRFT